MTRPTAPRPRRARTIVPVEHAQRTMPSRRAATARDRNASCTDLGHERAQYRRQRRRTRACEEHVIPGRERAGASPLSRAGSRRTSRSSACASTARSGTCPIRRCAGFDSNGILTSPQAFPLGIPDASLAVTGLGMMIALATAGGTTRRLPIMDVALGHRRGDRRARRGALSAHDAEAAPVVRLLPRRCVGHVRTRGDDGARARTARTRVIAEVTGR